ncbi:hypothetical protein ACHAPJ_011039 [Fusarium lateritium]
MPPDATVSFANGWIEVFPGIWKQTKDSFKELCHTLKTNSVAVEELVYSPHGNEMGEVTQEQYVEICEHLLQAYGHQVAVVTKFPKDGFPELQDFLSKQPLQYSHQVAFAPDWKKICKAVNGRQIVGVYTKMIRELTGRTSIVNWTWIPTTVWRKWKSRPDSYQGLDSLTATWPGPWFNEDESPGVQLQL